jgi:transcriptional regulator with XRE-family HTH domain
VVDARRFERAACEILRAIRGGRSQVAFARRIGYRGNPITDWEHGRRYPTAPEALRVAARVRFDVAAAFAPFLPAPPPTSGEQWSVAQWLDSLRGSTPVADLARRAERSRFSVSRWLSGRSTPRLPDFLRLLEAITGRAAEWVSALVPIERVPSLASEYRRVSAARNVAADCPWSEAIMRVMETGRFRGHRGDSVAFIAEALGASDVDIRQALLALEQAGLIEANQRAYRVTGTLMVDTKLSVQGRKRLRAHWATVAQQRVIADGDDETWFAYNVISVSASDYARIEQRLRAAYREVRSIVQASEPVEVAALLTMQLCPWPAASATKA